MVTIQFEITTARRGQLTTTIKEKTFKCGLAYAKWLEKNDGNVTVLRFLSDRTQQQEDGE